MSDKRPSYPPIPKFRKGKERDSEQCSQTKNTKK
jgi:hypothetical protein